jgi:hypothetical protein
VFARRKRQFLPLALIGFVAGVSAAVLQREVTQISVVHNATLEIRNDAMSRLLLALSAGALVTVPLFILVVAAGVATAFDLDGPPSLWQTLRRMHRQHILSVVATVTIVLIVTGVLFAPLAVYLAGRWAAAPGAAPGSRNTIGALRASGRLTRGHRVSTTILATAALIITGIAGPVLGVVLLVMTDRSFAFVNLVSSVATALLLPWLAIVVAMIYEDLALRGQTT